MTRDEAAAILGVTADADSSEVQHAFRQAVKSNHPDVTETGVQSERLGSGETDSSSQVRRSALDLSDVTEARDVLLARRAPTTPPQSPVTPKPRPASKTPVADSVDDPVPPLPGKSKASNAWLAIAAGLFGVVIFFLVTLTVIALAFGDEVPADTERLNGGVSGALNECVVVRVETVAARPCTAMNAQRIDSTIAGPGNCPVGTNTLDVGDTTYCLRPVAP